MNKPANLLIIMTDQQRWDALSCARNRVLQTPNLDRLAANGAFFKTAMSPCPVCGPARSSIFTGCTLETNGVRTNMDADGEDSAIMPRQTYDEILVDEGYTAEYYGKWHSPLHRALKYNNAVTPAGRARWERGLGLQAAYLEYLEEHVPIRELNKGEQYDTYSQRPYRMDPLDSRYNKPPGEQRPPTQPNLHGTLDLEGQHTATAFTATGAMEAMERLQAGPFAITCSFHHPHAPILPNEPYASRFIEPHERAGEPFACAEWHWRKDTEPNVMIRTDRWKLFIPNTPTSTVLDAMYDLDNDPHEMNNLLGLNPDAPRYAAQAEHLKSLMLSWLEDVNYPHIDGVRARELGKVVR